MNKWYIKNHSSYHLMWTNETVFGPFLPRGVGQPPSQVKILFFLFLTISFTSLFISIINVFCIACKCPICMCAMCYRSLFRHQGFSTQLLGVLIDFTWIEWFCQLMTYLLQILYDPQKYSIPAETSRFQSEFLRQFQPKIWSFSVA